MPDSSSVRAKVAQYFVNKQLEDLDLKNPQIEIDDSTLKFLSGIQIRTDQPASDPPQLPPAPTPHIPGEGYYSWKGLLEIDRARRAAPSEGRRLMIPQRVAIIGAGVAGLRTAMLLQNQKPPIPYKILEACDRVGGRLFTYQFPSKPPENPQGKHDYYDIGGMRFPDNDANEKTFALFQELGLSSKMIKYVFSRDDNIRSYNSEC